MVGTYSTIYCSHMTQLKTTPLNELALLPKTSRWVAQPSVLMHAPWRTGTPRRALSMLLPSQGVAVAAHVGAGINDAGSGVEGDHGGGGRVAPITLQQQLVAALAQSGEG